MLHIYLYYYRSNISTTYYYRHYDKYCMLYKIFYTNKFVNNTDAGTARAMFIWIRPSYKNDKGLLEHELVHVRQFWRNPLFFGLLYRFSEKYRFNSEVEAYREQLKHYPDDRSDLFAKFIVENYRLKVTHSEAKFALLTKS